MTEPSVDGEQPRELRKVPSKDDKYVHTEIFYHHAIDRSLEVGRGALPPPPPTLRTKIFLENLAKVVCQHRRGLAPLHPTAEG